MDPENYLTVSNLSMVSKLVERLVLVRLRLHLLASVNFNPLQSAYHTGHSTKMAIIKILDDFYAGINNKQLTILVSLDISAAFDIICHSKLLQRLVMTSEYVVLHSNGLTRMHQIINSLSSGANTQLRLHTVHQEYHKDPSSGRCFLLHTCRQMLM